MIGRVGGDTTLLQKLPTQAVAPAKQASLASRFADHLKETSELVGKAESAAASMATGETGSVETILALSRAELALRHVVSVRNRMLEAYQEVMRLPL
jgi:flagellar hook-basal body complex protein FliE